MVEEAKFHAWLDGELDGDEAAAVAAAFAADSVLQQRAEQLRDLGEQLRAAFAPVAAEPVPPPLARAAAAAPVIDFAAARERRQQRRVALPQFAALAATLAVGIAAGTLLASGSSAPVAVEGGRLVAEAGLGRALDVQLAAAGEQEGIRLGLSFRERSGAMCRSFTADEMAGLACRDGDRWAVRGLFATTPGEPGDYRQAAGTDPQLAQLIDETMAGEPLDAAAERRARDRGWR